MRIITRDANLDEFEFKARANVSTIDDGGDSFGGDIAVSVPVIPGRLAVRAVASYKDEGGWVDHPADINVFGEAGAEDANEREVNDYRIKVNAQPTDQLAVELGVLLSSSDSDTNGSRSTRDYLSPLSLSLIHISEPTRPY